MKVPKKNISRRLADIKNRSQAVPEAKAEAPIAVERIISVFKPVAEKTSLPKRKWPQRLTLIAIVFALLVFAGYEIFARSGSIAGIRAKLNWAAGEGGPTGETSGLSWEQFSAKLKPIFEEGGGFYGDLGLLGSAFLNLSSEAAKLDSALQDALLGKSGEPLLRELKSTENYLNELSSTLSSLTKEESILSGENAGARAEILGAQLEVNRISEFLKAFITWLAADEPHRLVVILGNSSELRPGGGFIGSYAELKLEKGRLAEINVRDINEPDRLLEKKIIPPRPLQFLVKNWRAADSNWFFDFSQSARKFIDLLSQSELYKGTKLEGVLAVSSQVVSDLLGMTGPIEAEGTVLTSKNFLQSIQTDVQSDQAEGAAEPKQLLKSVAPLLLQGAAKLSLEDKRKLLEKIGEWVKNKDLLFYFTEPEFEKLASAYESAGKAYILPRGENVNYLAVVNANVGGGKSDLYLDQNIFWQVRLRENGGADYKVLVEKTHRGNQSSFWWYQVPSEHYTQVIVPKDSILLAASGGRARGAPPRTYDSTYERDPDVVSWEASRKINEELPMIEEYENGNKRIFATWMKTPVGETSRLTLEYSGRLPKLPLIGQTYSFVVEKQAMSRSGFKLETLAPAGFRFRENHLPVYEYETPALPGRLSLELTLEAVPE